MIKNNINSDVIIANDKNLIKIKEETNNVLPDSRIILFGSRSKGDFDKRSDYDIIVISKQNLDIREKHEYGNRIRKQLSKIPIDIIVKTEEDINYYKDKIGSVVRIAISQGINL